MLEKSNALPDIKSIRAAAVRIAGHAVHTPLLADTPLDRLTDMRVFLKPECLQHTGSFKFRGAYNALAKLGERERKAGVVACSSGNHAQGVAEAARLLGIRATIVMPDDAPSMKIARTRRSGAEIVMYDRAKQDRDAIAAEIRHRTGAEFIHPYNHPDVIAGQGTCGLEICGQLREFGAVPDRVLVCTGGGGLTAGVALAIHASHPGARIHTVEPVGFDDTRRSLQTGKRQENKSRIGSACDALLSPSPGEVSFEINRRNIESGLTVTDQQAFDAMRVAYEELKLVLEPGGAVALAALLANCGQWRGETAVCILTGGNVDNYLFAGVINRENQYDDKTKSGIQPHSSDCGGETIELE